MGLPAHIEIEHWDGPRSRRERLENPSVLLLHDQLTRLDGDRIDSLWIEIENVGALDVGGGPDSFVVVAFPADGSSSHVESERKGQERVEFQVGGQTGVF